MARPALILIDRGMFFFQNMQTRSEATMGGFGNENMCLCVLMGGGLGKKLGLDWFVFLLHTTVARLK